MSRLTKSHRVRPQLTKPAFLLVDGYNIIGAHPPLERLRDREGLEESRRALVELLANFSAYQNYQTKVVFDAHYADVPGSAAVVTELLQICYTDFGQTADSYIERACALFFREDIRRFDYRLIVATSDRAQWLTAVGYGAEWMSAQKLCREAIATTHQTKSHRPIQPSSSKRFLAQHLDTKVQDKLHQLRQDLFQDGR